MHSLDIRIYVHLSKIENYELVVLLLLFVNKEKKGKKTTEVVYDDIYTDNDI